MKNNIFTYLLLPCLLTSFLLHPMSCEDVEMDDVETSDEENLCPSKQSVDFIISKCGDLFVDTLRGCLIYPGLLDAYKKHIIHKSHSDPCLWLQQNLAKGNGYKGLTYLREMATTQMYFEFKVENNGYFWMAKKTGRDKICISYRDPIFMTGSAEAFDWNDLMDPDKIFKDFIPQERVLSPRELYTGVVSAIVTYQQNAIVSRFKKIKL